MFRIVNFTHAKFKFGQKVAIAFFSDYKLPGAVVRKGAGIGLTVQAKPNSR